MDSPPVWILTQLRSKRELHGFKAPRFIGVITILIPRVPTDLSVFLLRALRCSMGLILSFRKAQRRLQSVEGLYKRVVRELSFLRKDVGVLLP